MRARTTLLILFAVLAGLFVFLNFGELARQTTLNLGVVQTQGPLGLVMLGLLLVCAVLFLGYVGAIQTSALMQAREHSKEMKAQRELAENAEASRFTELRALVEHLQSDAQSRHDALHHWLDERLGTLQHDVSQRVDIHSNSLAASMGELDDRLQRHWGIAQSATAPTTPPSPPPSPLPLSAMAADMATNAAQAAPTSNSKSVMASITNTAKRLFGADRNAVGMHGEPPLNVDAPATDNAPHPASNTPTAP